MHYFTINPISYVIGAASVATVGCIFVKKVFDSVFHNKMEEYSKFVCNNMFYFVRNCMYDITDEIYMLKMDIQKLIKKQHITTQNVETQTYYELPKLKIDMSVISSTLDNIDYDDDDKNDGELNNHNHEQDNCIVNGVMPTQFVHSIYDITSHECDYEHIE